VCSECDVTLGYCFGMSSSASHLARCNVTAAGS